MKDMLTALFDFNGILHHGLLRKGQTIINKYYLRIKSRLCEANRQKRILSRLCEAMHQKLWDLWRNYSLENLDPDVLACIFAVP